MKREFEIVVIGGGHAGIEAAAAASRMGCATLLVSLALDKVGELSCNPAIGGVGKGQLVKEVDALGGWMGELADATCIQFKQLNTTRGAAVRSTRMQVDREKYRQAAQSRLAAIPTLTLWEDEVLELVIDQAQVTGVILAQQGLIACQAVVITPGTFFHGLIHIGPEQIPGGRLEDKNSSCLPDQLAGLGIVFGRFKTGTTPRLRGASIDFSQLTEQPGDSEFIPFSHRSPEQPVLRQIACYIGHTNPTTHTIIRDNLKQSALYSGQILGTGVRYCPSIEDKIVKFGDRDSHHVFVEPEGLDTDQYYPNGTSNSLPLAIQLEMVHSIAGLEHVEFLKPGYGIEHDYVLPTQLLASLELKTIRGLFFAGQINGTTGYEEAAAQGLIAGINAVLRIRKQPPFILDRSQAYIGVLIDDLVTKGTNEPYRMFTSRVEYRLVIREDNADTRLTALGYQLGLISEQAYHDFLARAKAVAQEVERLTQTRISASPESDQVLQARATPAFTGSVHLIELLRRPELGYRELEQVDAASRLVPRYIRERVEVEVKYAGYIQKQGAEIAKFQHLENIRVPEGFVYRNLPGLSLEVAEKLTQLQPNNLGQAGRVSGITPGALTQLIYHIEKNRRQLNP